MDEILALEAKFLPTDWEIRIVMSNRGIEVLLFSFGIQQEFPSRESILEKIRSAIVYAIETANDTEESNDNPTS